MAPGQAPADLHSRRKGRLEVDVEQAGHADEGAAVLALQRPQAKAVFTEMPADFANQRGALQARQGRWKVAHHLWVGAQRRELAQVIVLPLAQHQPCAFQFKNGCHGAYSGFAVLQFTA